MGGAQIAGWPDVLVVLPTGTDTSPLELWVFCAFSLLGWLEPVVPGRTARSGLGQKISAG